MHTVYYNFTMSHCSSVYIMLQTMQNIINYYFELYLFQRFITQTFTSFLKRYKRKNVFDLCWNDWYLQHSAVAGLFPSRTE